MNPFSFIGRWLAKISFSAILKNFDVDFFTNFDKGEFYAVVTVHIFGRRLFRERYNLLDLAEALKSILDIDLVQKPDGEYLKIQFELGGRVIVKEFIKLSSNTGPASKKTPKVLTLDSPIDEVRENQLTAKEFSKMLSDVALGK